MEEKPATSTGRRLFIVLAVLVLLGLAGGGVFALKSNQVSYVNEEKVDVNRQLLFATTNLSDSDKDTDNDGLKNWEETLWNTDKNNPDTDGDGTSDGDEIEAGRDPTRAGPDDALVDNVSKLIISKNNYDPDNLNETDTFTQKFFTSYIYSRGSSPLTAASQEALVRELADELPPILAEHYDVTDLSNIAGSDATNETLLAYGNELGNILYTYGTPNVGYELEIVQKALDEKDAVELSKLDLIIESYETLIANYLVMSVPESAVANHLGFMNALSLVKASLLALRQVLDDPIIALSGMQAYNIGAEELAKQFVGMGNFLTGNNLEFETSEGGYLFTSFASL